MTNTIKERFKDKFVKQGIPIGIRQYLTKDGLDITSSKIIEFIELEIDKKAKQSITLYNQALKEVKLSEEVWKKIASANKQILDN